MGDMSSPAAETALDLPALAQASMDKPQRESRRLTRAAQLGDRAALEALVSSHWGGAYRVALLVSRDHAAAEDIAQEALLSALRSLPRFDPRRSFGSWLHRIVTNRAIDHVRERERRAALVERAADRDPVGAPAGLPPALTQALDRLDAEDRAIVVLRHLFDYRSREIGKILGLPAGTVRRRLADALAELRAELEATR